MKTIVDTKNFKKWILPILMFVFCEFIFKRKILPIFRKFVLTGDYFFDGILFDGLGYIFIILSVLLISKYVYNGKFNSIDASSKKGLKESFLFSIVILILTIIFLFILNNFLVNVLGIVRKSKNTIFTVYLLKKTLFSVFVIVFTGPMFEEIVYRKILFGYLYDLHSGCNRHVRFITSLLVSAIIFGAIHDGALSSGMIYYVIAGISFTVVYYYTKRISAAIAIHFLYDVCLQSIMMYIYS